MSSMLTLVLQEPQKREKKVEKYFEIITENFPNLGKETESA